VDFAVSLGSEQYVSLKTTRKTGDKRYLGCTKYMVTHMLLQLLYIPRTVKTCPLSVLNIAGDIIQPFARISLLGFHEAGAVSEWPDPLRSLDWAYQERMVASRVLYFTKAKLISQCFQCAGTGNV
jgi:hypothetical protein